MNEKLWDNPEKFDPTRFIVDGVVRIPDHFIPFSVGEFFRVYCINHPLLIRHSSLTGRRMCLGNVLTKMELFLFLSSLVQKYELKLSPHEEMPSLIGTAAASLVPKPFRVVLSPRKNANEC